MSVGHSWRPSVVLEIQLPGILIIGYGNLLRGDDGAGVLAARELEQYFQDDDEIDVIAAQLLTPEMAEIISCSSFVLFLDACREETPGSIRCEPVDAEIDTCRFTHHLTPASMLKTAQQIYGQAPPAMSLTVTGWEFALNNDLSIRVRERLPEFIRQAKETVASYRGLAETPTAPCWPVG
jgi:hydrogenase maturation protease